MMTLDHRFEVSDLCWGPDLFFLVLGGFVGVGPCSGVVYGGYMKIPDWGSIRRAPTSNPGSPSMKLP